MGVRSRRTTPAIVVIAAIALLSACSPQAPAEPATASAGKSLAERVAHDRRPFESDAVIAELVDTEKPGCSAAVAVHGEVLWAGAGGLADRKAGTPITTSTRFDIASASKQFTATAILLLEREGELSLDDPVSKYVDGLPAWGRTTTLEQLMHHTSHVRDYWQRLDALGIDFADTVSQAETVRAIAELPTLEPGTGYLYSNSNYVLLAEVVRKVSGEKLPSYLQSEVFGPLGLAMELHPNLVAPDVALSYDDDGSRQVSGWSAYGAVGIFTTPSELARWGDQYRASTIVGDYADGSVKSDEGRYGAGIDLHKDGSLGHDGRFRGHITAFEVSPDRETTIVVMCNGHKGPRWPITDALRELWVTPPATPAE